MKKWKKLLACTTMGLAAFCCAVAGVALYPLTVERVEAADIVYSDISRYNTHWDVESWDGYQATNEGVYFQDMSGVNDRIYVNSPRAAISGGYKSNITSKKFTGNGDTKIWLTGNVNRSDYWGYNWVIFQDTSEKFDTTKSVIGKYSVTRGEATWNQAASDSSVTSPVGTTVEKLNEVENPTTRVITYTERTTVIDEDTGKTVTEVVVTKTPTSITTYSESSNWTPKKVLETDGNTDNGADMPAHSTGNWLAVVTGISEGAVNLYRCTDGIISLVTTLTTDASAYTVHKTIDGDSTEATAILFHTKDTQMGTVIDITYQAKNGQSYTYTYESKDNSFWGEHSFTIGYLGNETFVKDATTGEYPNGSMYYIVSGNESDVTHTYESFNTVEYDANGNPTGNWVEASNITSVAASDTTPAYLKVQAATGRPTGYSDYFNSHAETKEVGGNSILDLTITANLGREAKWDSSQNLWAYDWLMFKNTNAASGRDWTPSSMRDTDGDGIGDTGESTGDWIALAFGASIGAKIYECNNGVVTVKDIFSELWVDQGVSNGDSGQMSGYDVWYTYAQTTHIKVATLDTDDGVWVNITYYAENCARRRIERGDPITTTGAVVAPTNSVDNGTRTEEDGTVYDTIITTTHDNISTRTVTNADGTTSTVYDYTTTVVTEILDPVESTGYVYEYTYLSENTALWGNQSYVIGHYGNGQFDDTHNYHYDLRIIDAVSTQTNNVAGNPAHWDLTNHYNATTNVLSKGDDGMRFKDGAQDAALMLRKNVEVDSTMVMTIVGNVGDDRDAGSTGTVTVHSPNNASVTDQAGVAIMLKDKSADIDPSRLLKVVREYGAMHVSADTSAYVTDGDATTVPNGRGTLGYVTKSGTFVKEYTAVGDDIDTSQNWVGLYMGNASWGLEVYECNEGILTRTSVWGDMTAYNNFNRGQTATFVIKTTDNEDGTTTISITFSNTLRSDLASSNSGVTVHTGTTYSYKTTGTKFAGDYGLSVGALGNLASGDYIDISWLSMYDAERYDSTQSAVNQQKKYSATGLYVHDARGASLSMEGNIAVNFYVAVSASVVANVTSQVDIYAGWTLLYSEFFSDLEKVEVNGTICYKIVCGIPAKDYQLNLRVILSIDGEYLELYNGTAITTYIDAVKAGESESNTEVETAAIAAAGAMGTYSEGARQWFTGEAVTAPSETVATTDVINHASSKILQKVWNTENTALTYKDFGYNSISLELKSELSFRMYIRTTDISKYKAFLDMDVSDNDTTNADTIMGGKVLEWKQRESMVGSEYYYVEVTGIKIADLDKQFAITVENQEDYSRCTFVFSPFSYMRSVFNTIGTAKEDTDLVNLMKQMYVYYQKANNYNAAIEPQGVTE